MASIDRSKLGTQTESGDSYVVNGRGGDGGSTSTSATTASWLAADLSR